MLHPLRFHLILKSIQTRFTSTFSTGKQSSLPPKLNLTDQGQNTDKRWYCYWNETRRHIKASETCFFFTLGKNMKLCDGIYWNTCDIKMLFDSEMHKREIRCLKNKPSTIYDQRWTDSNGIVTKSRPSSLIFSINCVIDQRKLMRLRLLMTVDTKWTLEIILEKI